MHKVLLILKLSKYKTTGFYNVNELIQKSDIINGSCLTKHILLYNSSPKSNKLVFYILTVVNAIKYSCQIIYALFSFKPQLIYFTISPVKSFYRDLLFVLILKLSKAKIVYHLHGKGIKVAIEKNSFRRSLYRFAYRKSNVICLSNELTYDISDIYSGKPYIVNNGVEIQTLDQFIKTQPSPKTPNILFLSNFIVTKGVLVLIDALEILLRKGLDFKAVLIGEYVDISNDQLNKYIESKNLRDVVILKGPKYGDDKYNELINADIFVFPTFYPTEAFPLVILEAMQFGLPIVSTFEAAIPEMVENGVTGLLVERQNFEQTAEALEVLIRNYELRVQMGKAGQIIFFEKYTLETFEKRMVKVFNEILIN